MKPESEALSVPVNVSDSACQKPVRYFPFSHCCEARPAKLARRHRQLFPCVLEAAKQSSPLLLVAKMGANIRQKRE
jgi:hypothetical protein